MLRLLLATLSLFSGYHALLVLTPLYLAATGADELVVGLATGSFMLLAVAGHVIAPSVVRHWGTRRPFRLALVGTAIAAVVHLFTAAALPLILLSAARGAVYGVGAVVSATAVAHLASPGDRAKALATYGSAAALPGLLASTAAVFVAERIGFAPAFAAIAALILLSIPLLAGPIQKDAARSTDADLRVGPLRPTAFAVAVIFAGFAMVYGAALTFVPVQLTRAGATAYPFVLTTALGLAIFRWAGGPAVGRWQAAPTLGLGLLLGGSAMVMLALLPPASAPGAGLVFGAGFGLGGTATHSLLTTTTEKASLGRANAIFNVAWSGGMGAGATVFGMVASIASVETSYLLASAWHGILGLALVSWFAASAGRRTPVRQHRPR